MTLQYKRIAGVEEKLQNHQFGLDIAFADDLLVNESEMSLWVPFASGVRRDGVGDLLEIGGIDTSRHIRNPVVLFDHGKAVQLPVGMSEDPDTKQYRVVLDPVAKVAKGKAYFYQGSKDMEGVGAGQVYEHALFCEQLFDLVVKRFIRAGSIGYQVKTARRLPADFNTGTPEGLHLISVLMLEFSVVVMPANADTVGKVLSLDKICGKRLSPYLVKSLAPYAPPRKAMMGYEGKARTPKQYPGDPPTLPGEGYNDSRNIGVGASTPNPNSVAGAETMVNLQQHTNQINAAERNRRMAEIQRQHHGLDVEEAEEKNLPRQGRKARTPNKYEGDSRPDVYGEGYNDSRNFTPTANPNSVAGAFRSNSHLPDDEYLEAHARIVRQHRGEETPEELDKAAEHNEWLSQQHLYPHPLRDIPGDERVRRAQKKRLPKQGQKANKKPTYRDVGAVPRTEFMGLADEQADLDQPFNTPHGLYSRSNYLPSYDPNTLAGHFAHTQEDGHDHMISRSEANDLATGRRQDTDIGEQGEYVPRPHPRDRKRKSIDKLSGGLADDKQPQDFDPAQLKAGIRVEMEHTDDSRLAREIAMDHLLEDPAYYQKLSRMEGKSVKAWSDELSNFSQGPDYEKHRDDILNTPLHLRNTSQHGVGDGPDAVRPRMTGQDRERQRLASLVMDEITNHDLGIDVEQAHLRERQEAQRNKQLPRQDRKANRPQGLRRDFDDTDLVQQMDQEQPGYSDNAEMVRSENANYIHGPRRERNRQRAIERADAANARELEKEQKANLDPRQRRFVDQLNQYTGQELPDEEYHEVPPQNVNLTPRQQIFMDNLERMQVGTPRRSVKALRKLYRSKAQPSDDIPKEKARQILKDGEVQGHPLTEKQRRMFGAAASKSTSDNDYDTPNTDLQRRIRETEAMRATGSPLVEEGRVDPREHRRMMINPSIRKPAMPTSHQQVNIGVTGMAIGGGMGSGITILEHMLKSKSLRIKSLRKMYGSKANTNETDRPGVPFHIDPTRYLADQVREHRNTPSRIENANDVRISQDRALADWLANTDADDQDWTDEDYLSGTVKRPETKMAKRKPIGKAPTPEDHINAIIANLHGPREQRDPSIPHALVDLHNEHGLDVDETLNREHARLTDEFQADVRKARGQNSWERRAFTEGTPEYERRLDRVHRRGFLNQASMLNNRIRAQQEGGIADTSDTEQKSLQHKTKMAKRKGESNEEYAYRMDREALNNDYQQYDQRMNDYYNAAMQAPTGPNPVITQHFDDEIQSGARDLQRSADARDRNFRRRLQGGKAYQEAQYSEEDESGNRELIQNGMDPAINDPKTPGGRLAKRDRERYGPHTNYEYRPEREPGTANMPDYEGQEFGARNQFAFENQPSREEQENEYQARRERYYEENKALPGERLPVPHGAEIHRNTIPPAHRDFRVISSKSAEGEDDLPDFYKPKEDTSLPEPTPRQARRQARRDIDNAMRAIDAEHDYHRNSESYRSVPVHPSVEQRGQRYRTVSNAYSANSEGNVPGVYEHLAQLPKKEDTIYPPGYQGDGTQKGLDLFSGATHGKIRKYVDQAFHSFETGQIDSREFDKRRHLAASVLAEMDKARGQFMRQKDDRLDHYNQQAVAGKSVDDPDSRSREERLAAWTRVNRNLPGRDGVPLTEGQASDQAINREQQADEMGLSNDERYNYLTLMQNRVNRYRGHRDSGMSHEEAMGHFTTRFDPPRESKRIKSVESDDDLPDFYKPKEQEKPKPQLRSQEQINAIHSRINRELHPAWSDEQILESVNDVNRFHDTYNHSHEQRDWLASQRLHKLNRYRGEIEQGVNPSTAFINFMTTRLEPPDRQSQSKGRKSVESEDDLPDFYKPKEGTSLPEPTPQQARLQAYRDIENARRAINREQKEDTVDAGYDSRNSQRLARRNITRSALNARTAGNISGAYEHLNRLPSKEDTLLPPSYRDDSQKSFKGRIKSLRKMYGSKMARRKLSGPEQLLNEVRSRQDEDVIDWDNSEYEPEKGKYPTAYVDPRSGRRPPTTARGDYGIEPGTPGYPPMNADRHEIDQHREFPGDIVPDEKSMDSDQEEVANKPLKDGVLPGLKRNKRSVNGDALLYVEEKDIPDVRKKADELGLKIHRITGNTPGYVRMRFQGNDDDIDTVARVFGRLADTKE